MRKVILAAKFSITYFDDECSLLEHIWQNRQAEMLLPEFKADLLAYANLVETYQAQKILVDATFINFTIMPDIQEWVDEHISKKVNKIAQKIAFVLPTDFFIQIAIEQTVSETEGSQFEESHFFDEVNTALKWLLRK
jgi:hypothetical protein